MEVGDEAGVVELETFRAFFGGRKRVEPRRGIAKIQNPSTQAIVCEFNYKMKNPR